MIKVNDLKVSFGKQQILKGVSFEFPKSGLFSICGPSGCGKSTFLNCLSGLLSFQGSIEVEGINISRMTPSEKDKLRLYSYGFIFQDFKLFENETVERNILFPLRMVSNDKEEIFTRTVDDLLSLVSITDKKKAIVSNLSGGQKQRVSIARALVNNPKIILADEPTGALDSATSEEIMTLLRQISKRVLVIMVTHDYESAKNYSDYIIKMSDGAITACIKCINEVKQRTLPICRSTINAKKPTIPSTFLIEHTFHSIKQKKGRSLLCGVITSLSLIGFGASIVLTDSISKNIKNSYGNLLEKDRITISLKNSVQSSFGKKAIELDTIKQIKEKNDEIVKDYGVVYENNFEEFFKDENSFYVSGTGRKVPLTGLSARSINDYKWLIENKEPIYPRAVNNLAEDEIILCGNYSLITEICYQLRIARTIDSFSEYLNTTPLYLYLGVANYDWQYSDEQVFRVAGFILDSVNGICHSSPTWNETIFEDRMRLPSSLNITGYEPYPWVLRKAYFLKTINVNDTYKLLKRVRNEQEFMDVILELPSNVIYPYLMKNITSENINRLIAYENFQANISPCYMPYFEMISPDISSPIFGCNSGYSIYPSNLMSGFSNNVYFSFNEESLTKVLDANSTLSVGDNEFSTLPKDVLSGHFAKSLQNSVKFSVFEGNLISGRAPNNIDEIAISKAMLSALTDSNVLDKPLLFSYTSYEKINEGKKTYREFITKEVKVVGIVDDIKYTIYQDSFWTIGYFQCFFGVSAFDLNINTISYKVNEKGNIEDTILSIQNKFPQFEIVNPFDDVNNSIDEICGWIEIALTIFSGIAVVTSILLLSICNYLHILDNKKDIALARCIGASKKESKKFIYSHSIIMCLISFILSSIELFVVSIFTGFALSKSLSVDFSLNFNPLSILLMLGLSVFISLLSSFLMGIKISKIDPLEALKY